MRTKWTGTSLLELLIALGIAMIVLAVILRMSGSTQQAYDTVSQDTDANFDLRRAGERVADELRQSAVSRIVVNSANADADTVTYQVPVGKVQDTVLWGARGNSGWYLGFLVVNRDLVRRTYDQNMNIAGMDEVLARSVDQSFAGSKGFSISVNGSMVTIGIRVTVTSGGETWRRDAQTSVLVRNS